MENRNAAIREMPQPEPEASSGDSMLSASDLRNLKFVGKVWVCASYLQDATMQRYHRLGLVVRDGERIRLTPAGWRACDPDAPPLRHDRSERPLRF